MFAYDGPAFLKKWLARFLFELPKQAQISFASS
jgi:hypothetical protein